MGVSVLATLTSLFFATVSPLVGAWESSQTFGHEISGGVLSISVKDKLTATIDGEASTVPLPRPGSVATVHFDNGGKAIVRTVGSAVFGQWVQPATVTYGEAYMTPVVFTKRSPSEWTGSIRPV